MSNDLSSKQHEATKRRSLIERSGMAYVLLFGVVFLFLAVQIVVWIVASLLLIAFGLSQDDISDLFNSPYALLAIGLAIDVVLVSLLYRLYRYFKLDFLRELALKPVISVKQAIQSFGYYGVYFIAFAIVWFVVSRFIPAIDTEQTQNLGFESLQGAEYIATFIALVILPPIVEEILFRGVLYQRLKRLMSTLTAGLLTSVVFAAAHLELLGDGPPNWIAAIDTFVLSVALILALERTKTLWSPILIHALKNAIAFTVVFVI